MAEGHYPQELRYTAEHEWVRRAGPTTLRFGITDYATDQLGDVVFVQLPAEGGGITGGQPCGEVESTKSVSDIYAPVTGRVSAVNLELESAPELVNSSPYDEGWMVEVELQSPQEVQQAWSGLLTAEAYAASLG